MATKTKSKYGSLAGKVSAGKEQTERQGGGGCLSLDGKKFWRPKKGMNTFDIIPYEVSIGNHPIGIEPGELFQQLKYKVHYEIGAENKQIVCPTTVGKKCPICEHRAALYKDPNADKDELQKLKPKDRIVFNIIDLDDEDEGIQIFDYSPHLFAGALYEELDATEGEFNNLFDLDSGFTIKARFAEKKLGSNKFLECTRVDFEERQPYGDDQVADCLDLDKALVILSYDEINKIFMDLDEEPTSGKADDDDEKPTGRQRSSRKPEQEEAAPSGRSRRNRTPEPDPEPEDDVPNEFPEDEPEPEPTSRRRGRRAEPEPEPETAEPESGDNQCPSGYNFGVDTDTEDACDKCPNDIWEACKKAKSESKPERRRRR